MSEQPVAAATRPAPARPPGKTYGGLSRNQWFIVGGVFIAAVGFILWRRHQAASSAASTTAPTNQGSNECTDANGNPVDCNEQFAQELSGLQNSLDQALAQGGGAGSGGGGTVGVPWSGNGTGTIPGDGTNTPTTATAPGTPTSTGGTTSTGTKTTPKTAGAITGLAASAVTKTSFKASWKAASNATGGYSYVVRDLASHSQVTSGTTRSTSVTISGLKSGIDYNFGIQALPGGAGDNIHVRTT